MFGFNKKKPVKHSWTLSVEQTLAVAELLDAAYACPSKETTHVARAKLWNKIMEYVPVLRGTGGAATINKSDPTQYVIEAR